MQAWRTKPVHFITASCKYWRSSGKDTGFIFTIQHIKRSDHQWMGELFAGNSRRCWGFHSAREIPHLWYLLL